MSALTAVSARATNNTKMSDQIWGLAACRGPHQEIFFPPSVAESRRSKRRREARAKEICGTCPISEACLRTALARNEQHGIWGGHTEKERRQLLTMSS